MTYETGAEYKPAAGPHAGHTITITGPATVEQGARYGFVHGRCSCQHVFTVQVDDDLIKIAERARPSIPPIPNPGGAA